MARRVSPTPTDAERAILEVLWKRKEASVREVTDELASPGVSRRGHLAIVKFLLPDRPRREAGPPGFAIALARGKRAKVESAH